MAGQRKYVSDFDNARRRAFVRSRSQAWFRGEAWTLTWEEYQVFWSTPKRWAKRGRQPEDLVLTRQDWDGVWSTDNCVIVTRGQHLKAIGNYKLGLDVNLHFTKAIHYGQ